jgi:ferredoxin
LPDTEDGTERWVEMNREYSEKWPNITQKGDAPTDGDDYKDMADKFDKFFSTDPGKGS